MFYLLYKHQWNNKPFNFRRERRDLLCNHSNSDLFTYEDNMLFSHVNISCFHAKDHLTNCKPKTNWSQMCGWVKIFLPWARLWCQSSVTFLPYCLNCFGHQWNSASFSFPASYKCSKLFIASCPCDLISLVSQGHCNRCIVTVKEFYWALLILWSLPLSFATCFWLMADAKNACAMDNLKTLVKTFLLKEAFSFSTMKWRLHHQKSLAQILPTLQADKSGDELFTCSHQVLIHWQPSWAQMICSVSYWKSFNLLTKLRVLLAVLSIHGYF